MSQTDQNSEKRPPETRMSQAAEAGYLVFDIEAIPDGNLVAKVRFPGQEISPQEAIRLAQDQEKAKSPTGSDFLPPTLQKPISICVIRVGKDFLPRNIGILDDSDGVDGSLVQKFWFGINRYPQAQLVTFNGRGYDVPLLELAAFELGIPAKNHYDLSRKRYYTYHIDIMDWMSNYRAFTLTGGLNLLAKKLGLPGKFDVSGDKVYELYQEGKLHEINSYCLCDTLDTYFVFLRTRVMSGEITLDEETDIRSKAIDWLLGQSEKYPIIRTWMGHWDNPPEALGLAV
jgi:predicted PolB exonuclease-like 3'-5' exonuclease